MYNQFIFNWAKSRATPLKDIEDLNGHKRVGSVGLLLSVSADKVLNKRFVKAFWSVFTQDSDRDMEFLCYRSVSSLDCGPTEDYDHHISFSADFYKTSWLLLPLKYHQQLIHIPLTTINEHSRS